MDARLGFEAFGIAPLIRPRVDADALVTRHLGLVRKLAWHVHSRVSSAIDVEDLIQIGTISLIEAARTFEDRGEASFATYATLRIRGGMIDALRKSATMVRSAMRRRREFGAARAALEGQLGRPATDAEMAARLDMGVDAYRTAVETTSAVRIDSLDDVYSDHSPWFADGGTDAFDHLAQDGLRHAVSAAIAALPPREALVLQLYFVEGLNLEEIGATLNVGAARICQIKKAALAKVRAQLRGWVP
jgi:RNA polymerase sigma factor for flagellar operon FliA